MFNFLIIYDIIDILNHYIEYKWPLEKKNDRKMP